MSAYVFGMKKIDECSSPKVERHLKVFSARAAYTRAASEDLYAGCGRELHWECREKCSSAEMHELERLVGSAVSTRPPSCSVLFYFLSCTQ